MDFKEAINLATCPASFIAIQLVGKSEEYKEEIRVIDEQIKELTELKKEVRHKYYEKHKAQAIQMQREAEQILFEATDKEFERKGRK